MKIRPAAPADLGALAELFDAYRQFYGQPSDIDGAAQFLSEHMVQGQSSIFVAEAADELIGFTQLYPSFSSTRMAPIFILNDLFVSPHARKNGAASALLRAAANYAHAQGALRLTLSTAHDNHAAQALYAREGWTQDQQFQTYNLTLR